MNDRIFIVDTNVVAAGLITGRSDSPTARVVDAMLDGKLNATSAFMAGKLKVKGDMSLAMKLQSLLG